MALAGSILHPSDFSDASDLAFAHALAIAVRCKSKLTILHATNSEHVSEESWRRFPSVRETLVRWGLLDKGSHRSDVYNKLSLSVKKLTIKKRTPQAAILKHVKGSSTDLIVLATEGKNGPARWLRRSVAEPVAREAREATLFVPKYSRGFVSLSDGRIFLRRIVIPVDREPRPHAAVESAAAIARTFGVPNAEYTIVHVGERSGMPEIRLPAGYDWSWHQAVRRGDVVDQIAAVAGELPADLIVMTTRGHEGFLDALRGSTTERVLRQAPCPVLAVPE